MFDQGLKRTSPEKLLKILKKNNRITTNVLWNHEQLTQQQLDENFERVLNIDDNAYAGYECSSCDPILFLMAELYNTSIVHDFNGVDMIYTNLKAKKRLRIQSNMHHMF